MPEARVRTTCALLAAGALGWVMEPPGDAAEMLMCVDVPSDFAGTEYLHYQTFKTTGSGPYTLVATLAELGDDTNKGAVGIDAAHEIGPIGGEFLFSANAPFTVSGVTYSQADVVRYVPGSPPTYSMVLDHTLLNFADPDAPVDVDALSLDSSGNVLLSFDVPVRIGSGVEFLPADVVRVVDPDGSGPLPPVIQDTAVFLGSAAGLDASVNTCAVEIQGSDLYMMFIEPLQSGSAQLMPGTIMHYDATSGLTPFWWDPAFPSNSGGAGLTFTGGLPSGLPGPVPDGNVSPGTPLTVQKGVSGKLDLTWGRSCVDPSSYAVYEGTLGSFTSHVRAYDGVTPLCSVPDPGSGSTASASVTPVSGNTYYIIVPRNGSSEGSYGVDGSGAARPPSANPCQSPQLARVCP